MVEFCSLPVEGGGVGSREEPGVDGAEPEEATGHRSPNKRHRSTPRSSSQNQLVQCLLKTDGCKTMKTKLTIRRSACEREVS